VAASRDLVLSSAEVRSNLTDPIEHVGQNGHQREQGPVVTIQASTVRGQPRPLVWAGIAG